MYSGATSAKVLPGFMQNKKSGPGPKGFSCQGSPERASWPDSSMKASTTHFWWDFCSGIDLAQKHYFFGKHTKWTNQRMSYTSIRFKLISNDKPSSQSCGSHLSFVPMCELNFSWSLSKGFHSFKNHWSELPAENHVCLCKPQCWTAMKSTTLSTSWGLWRLLVVSPYMIIYHL